MRDDLESRATADDHDDLRLWLRIMTVHKLIDAEVRRRLRARFALSLPRFDLMAQLARSPDGIRMGELSQRLMVTNGNVTQLADQLEREGLVERTADARNRRASLIRLTANGRRRFDLIARANERWIIELFAGLSRPEKRLMFAALAKHKAFLSTLSPPGRGRSRRAGDGGG
jgi:DNA-binding MarR family transcriptional regulator